MKNVHIQALLRLYTYAKSFRLGIFLASVYSTLNTLLDILPDFLIGMAVDVIINKQASFVATFGIKSIFSQLITLGIVMGIIWLLQSLIEYLCSVKWRTLAQQLQHHLRIDAYKHIQSVEMQYLESVTHGQLVSILNDDINQLERFFDNGVNMVIHIVTSLLFIALFFFLLAPKLALFAFLPVPIIIFGAYYFQNLLRPQYEKVRLQAGELNNRFTNNLNGIATIKSYAAEKYELRVIEKQSQDYQQANTSAIHLTSLLTPAIRLTIMFGFLTTLIYGGFLTLQGTLSVSIYSILIFLSQRLLWPLTYLAEVLDQLYRALAAINRVLNLFFAPLEVQKAKIKSTVNTAIQGEIKFEKLSFNYKNRKSIINSIDLIIPAGKTVAFVGSTGTGKSTLTKLLLRFYEPTAGHIFLDGKDLKEYDLLTLRSSIAYVSQDVFLFKGTIAENIAYGSFNASLEAVKNAAKLAFADEFIVQLPQGYQTRMNDRGVKFSGGQKQRLSIARAILKNPPLFILDEATSAIDNATESAIQNALQNILINKTTIIIAHRLNTVRNADHIYVFDKGTIIEQGDHLNLIKQNGKYAALWRLQTGLTN